MVLSAIEHPAVVAAAERLSGKGLEVRRVGICADGRVDLQAMAAALDHSVSLVSVMLANNETGVLQPIAELGRTLADHQAWLHADCAQAVGKVPVRVRDLGLDLASLAGHKLYAPKGVGILALRDGVELPNLMFGAGHEAGRRPGTENILEIAGLGEACRLAGEEGDAAWTHLAGMRDELQGLLRDAVPDAVVHGDPGGRLPNTLSIGFPGVTAAAVMEAVPHVAVSAGAACHGGGATISHVLAAMGVAPDIARGTLRFSVGRFTTGEEIRSAATAVTGAVSALRR